MSESGSDGEAVRVVTARQLARAASALLDEVSDNKTPLLITRHGLPVAEIYPAQASTLASAIRVMESPGVEPTLAVDELEDLDLDDTERRVLEAFVDAPHLDGVIASTELDVVAASCAVSRLELKRLVIRERVGVKLSRLGERAAATLRTATG